MADITIYHNPRCSKSRQTLAILEATGQTVEVINYLDNPPSEAKLKQILSMLELEPRELMRKNEAPFAELNLADTQHSKQALIKAMVTHPILIERPIVVSGNAAVIGRPPENVEKLL